MRTLAEGDLQEIARSQKEAPTAGMIFTDKAATETLVAVPREEAKTVKKSNEGRLGFGHQPHSFLFFSFDATMHLHL